MNYSIQLFNFLILGHIPVEVQVNGMSKVECGYGDLVTQSTVGRSEGSFLIFGDFLKKNSKNLELMDLGSNSRYEI